MPEIDPYRSDSFKLELRGVAEGHFTECSGLNAKIESIAYREAGNHPNRVTQAVGPIWSPDHATQSRLGIRLFV